MAREYSLTEIRETIARMRRRVESGAYAPHMAAARLGLGMAEQLLALAKGAVSLEELRKRDAELHPWGEPGEISTVPMDGGKVWYVLPGDEPGRALILSEPTKHRPYTVWSVDEQCDVPEELIVLARFRKRWTPVAP